MTKYQPETVAVCQINGQWGIWLKSGSFITSIPRLLLRSTCSVDGCNGNAIALGLCRLHYNREWPQRSAGLLTRPEMPGEFVDKQAVLNAIEHIQVAWHKEYGDELPWQVRVLEVQNDR